MKTNYIVFHEGCQDGFIAGYLAFLLVSSAGALKRTVMTPAVYSDEPVAAIKGDTILLVDFSYSKKVLDDFHANGVSVIMADHHKSAILDIVGKDNEAFYDDSLTQEVQVLTSNKSGSTGLFTDLLYRRGKNINTNYVYFLSCNDFGCKDDHLKHSGASIVYKLIKDLTSNSISYVNNKRFTAIKDTVELARMQDLWLHNGEIDCDASYLNYYTKKFLKDHESFFESMKKVPKVSCILFEELMDRYDEHTLKEKLSIGKELATKDKENTYRYVDSAKDVKLVDGLASGKRIAYVEATYASDFSSSLIGSILTREKGYDAAIMLNRKPRYEECIYSLRANGKLDVSELAKTLVAKGYACNGGGHSNAAGLKVKDDTKFFTIY